MAADGREEGEVGDDDAVGEAAVVRGRWAMRRGSLELKRAPTDMIDLMALSRH